MLSDAQLGLLTGFAFALFYTFAGLPIASLADRGNRRNIVAISLTIWSGMTAISGLAQNYWQLLLARVGVGIGEAGGSPLALDDFRYFPSGKTCQCDRLLLDGHQHRHSIWLLVRWLVERILWLACCLLCGGCPRRHPRSWFCI